MRAIRASVILFLLLSSCGVVKKKTTYASPPATVSVSPKTTETPTETTPEEFPEFEEVPIGDFEKADRIINTAMTYSGVRYKFGGMSRSGMDCSGLLYLSFGEHGVDLPRVSYQMAELGRKIKVRRVVPGDLLFFRTSRRGRRINHVGLVVEVRDDDIRFIHATTSRGVIVSSLHEGFWNFAFVKATRIL